MLGDSGDEDEEDRLRMKIGWSSASGTGKERPNELQLDVTVQNKRLLEASKGMITQRPAANRPILPHAASASRPSPCALPAGIFLVSPAMVHQSEPIGRARL
jgi:hypothetical protein